MADPTVTSHVQQIATEWEKLVTSQLAHLETFFGEVAKIESRGAAQVVSALDEVGRYARDSVGQAEKVTTEWRRLGLDAARRTAQFVTTKPSV